MSPVERALQQENERLKIKCRLFDHIRQMVKLHGYSSISDAVAKAEERATRIDELLVEKGYAEAQVDHLKVQVCHLQGQIEHYRDLVHERA